MQFMNWALMDNGAWDYPADTRGYMPGVVAEYIRKSWALRYGAVMVPTSVNGAKYDFKITQALSHNLEFEKSYKLCAREGTARILAYYNHAHMGDYKQSVRDALNAGTIPDFKATRAYRAKYGFGVNLEQKIFDDLGAFSRTGWNDGRTETWMFTEIDRTISLGLSLSGKRWKRDGDQIGLAGVVNGISGAHKSYLEHGGRGYIIGDGRLNYATEKIIESYYKVAMNKNLFLTLDYQFIHAPAYNKDRGPVNIGGVRFHVEF